ncbi:MAG TPA: T9SS type A sorting domain-containing protein [Bacteroidales bacterium]|nr:T9SS type A sorting domain-containing protein [Bacteroidales bacterium]HOX77379.1 T9SS type A sorting domain-containing protein [Bacteroidales bacterium]
MMKRIFTTLIFLSLVGFLSLSAQTRVYTPELSQPVNGAVDQMPDAVLDWNAVTGGNTGVILYDVQLDDDPAFGSPANFQTELVSAYKTANLGFGQTYYWRVRARDGNDVSDWSAAWSFRVIRRVVLKSPTDASTQNTDLTLGWNPITGLTQYEYQFDTSYYWNTMSSGITTILYDVATVDETHAWAVGAGGKVLFFDGNSWTAQTSSVTVDLYDVHFLDVNNGWAAGKSGKIIHYDGTQWAAMTTNTSEQVNGITMLSPTSGWAVTKDSAILYYNGANWAEQYKAAKEMTKIIAVDASHVWAVGKGGVILFYNGSSWTAQQSGTAKDILDAAFVSPDYGWAVGKTGTLIEYKNGTWVPFVNSLTNNRDVNSIKFNSPTSAFAVGKTGLMLQFDGIEWYNQSSGTATTLNGVSMAGTTGFLVGESGVIVSYNDEAFTSPLATIHPVAGDITTTNLIDLLFGEQYYWRMRAKHSQSTSDWSGVRSFITINTVELDKPPNNTTNADLDIELKWKKVSNLVTYEIQIDDDVNFGSPIFLASSGIAINAELLKFGTAYNWRVRALHAFDQSDWSAPWKFTTVNAVTLESPANNSTDIKLSPLLTWKKITGIAGYQVMVADNNGFNNPLATAVVDAAENSFIVPLVLDKDASYFWKVRAINGLDTSNWSPAWTFKTMPPVGIGEPTFENSIEVFPNPADDIAFIRFNGKGNATLQLTLSDIVGMKVMEKTLNYGEGLRIQSIDVSGLKKGIYLVRLTHGNSAMTRKLIIK